MSIPVYYASAKFLVFDVSHIKQLRELHIVGTLSGTLPVAPQQNLFLGVPLQLMLEEVIWLVVNDHVTLVNGKEFTSDLYHSLTQDDLQLIESSRQEDLNRQKQEKIKEHELTNAKYNKSSTSTIDESSLDQSLLIKILDTPYEFHTYHLFQQIHRFNSSSFISKQSLRCSVFQYLHSKGYYLAPGLRFGGEFIAYPGDPLRYHAHLIINCFQYDEKIKLIDLVSGGRLATGVKKLWTVASKLPQDNDERKDNGVNDDVFCFTIEWSGFG